jgi:adhesin transport system outer membrane protein
VAAAVAERQTKTAPMLPRLDVRLTRQLNDDTDGIEGSYRKNTAEVVVSYNIFNGGADRARAKQFEGRVSTARELRELACREVRQTLAIAHNDIKSLTAQVDYLNRNQLAIGKARLTYRQQFSIGQRTLLDLLDSENEYFEIRRRYVNARYDLGIAQARTLGAMGMLRESLGVDDRAEEAGLDVTSSDSASGCPLDAPPPMRIKRREPTASVPTASVPAAPAGEDWRSSTPVPASVLPTAALPASALPDPPLPASSLPGASSLPDALPAAPQQAAPLLPAPPRPAPLRPAQRRPSLRRR